MFLSLSEIASQITIDLNNKNNLSKSKSIVDRRQLVYHKSAETDVLKNAKKTNCCYILLKKNWQHDRIAEGIIKMRKNGAFF